MDDAWVPIGIIVVGGMVLGLLRWFLIIWLMNRTYRMVSVLGITVVILVFLIWKYQEYT